MREVVAEVASHRPSMDGYEVSAAIVPTGDEDADRQQLADFADAGVTWAHFGPAGEGETIEEVAGWIAAGPPSL